MALLDTIDLLKSDVSIGDMGHDDMHDWIHVGLKDLKTVLNTLSGETARIIGDQTIAGNKTFSGQIFVPTATQSTHAVNKGQMDTALSGKTDTGHSHTIANITSLQSTLDGKQPMIAAGTTAQYYRGDKTWATLDKTAANVKEFGDLIATYNTAVGFTTLDFSIAGNYIVGSNVTDMPTTGQTWNITIASTGANGILAIAIRSGSAVPYMRVKQSTGTWGGWQSVSGGYSTLSVAEGQTGTATNQRVITAADLKTLIQYHAQTLVDTGTVKTSGDQTVGGVKTFSSAPRLTTTSTAGYAWVATGTDGSGAWNAIVNAPGGTVPWANITGKPSTFTPESHTHTVSQITDFSSTLASKADAARTITAGTGLSGGGDLTANRTLSVIYGTAAGTAAQGNDSRLSDQRTPTDGSVTTAKMATSARPYDFSFTQSLDTRAVGYGEMLYGIRIAKSIVITSIHYRMGTADASGVSYAEIRKASTASGTPTLISGTGGTLAVDPTPATGSFSVSAGEYLWVYCSAIGTTPGKGLIAEIQAYLA